MKSIALFVILALGFLVSTAQADGTVVVLEIKGGIGVATADYVISGIEHAEETNAELIIMDLDTPGGLMNPMRDMIQAILGSKVPIATYVTPAGARADSAGTYILLASHIAVMAPTTHLGAATPVSLNGDDATPESDEPTSEDDGGESDSAPQTQPGTSMERKVLNDAVAYIRGLAERHGRNADWAESAVRDAATLTANEALEENVIEFIAADHAELLQLVDGLEIELETRKRMREIRQLGPVEVEWKSEEIEGQAESVGSHRVLETKAVHDARCSDSRLAQHGALIA